MNTNDTNPATSSQHPRTNEGACESEVALLRAQVEEWEFRWNGEKSACDELEAELTKVQAKFATQIDLLSGIVGMHRAALEHEQAAHALTKDTYSTGAKMNAAMLDSTRARITELCDAWKNYMTLPMEQDAWEHVHAQSRALMEVDAMVRKHADEGVSEDEAVSEKALVREGFVPQDELRGRWAKPIGPDTQLWWDAGFHSACVELEDALLLVPNCRTVRDLHQLVRLFTAPDAARARDEEAS